MSSIATAPSVPSLQRTLKVAGIAGILHGVAHVLWIALNQLVLMPAGDPDALSTPTRMQADFTANTALAILFTAIGALAVVAASGLVALARSRGSVLTPTISAFGAAFGIATIAVAASGAAIRGFPNEYIAASGAPEATQAAVVEGMFAVPQTLTFLAVLLFAGWCVLVAVAGAAPVWLRVVNVVVAVLVTAVLFVAGAAGLMLSTVYFIVLGVWMLRAARRAG